jgi:hypothetical protein
MGYNWHPNFYYKNYITFVFNIEAGNFASSTSAMLATDYFAVFSYSMPFGTEFVRSITI